MPWLPDDTDGVVTRSELLAHGWTPGQVRAQVDGGRWQRLHPGVYATFSGPIPEATRVRAALATAGRGAALTGRAALWSWGVIDTAPAVIEVALPAERRVVRQPGVKLLRHRRFSALVHPATSPPRLRVEAAVIDAAEATAREEDVVTFVLRAVQQRLTTAPRLRAAAALRGRLRHRNLLADLLSDAGEGAHSALERRYLRTVHRAHGLPTAEFNIAVTDGQGRRRYADVRYRHVIVELDGAEAHPLWQRARDRFRDADALVEQAAPTLRYGWAEVVGDPCRIAVHVVRLLHRGGWRGRPLPCGPGCPVATTVWKIRAD